MSCWEGREKGLREGGRGKRTDNSHYLPAAALQASAGSQLIWVFHFDLYQTLCLQMSVSIHRSLTRSDAL